MHLEGVLQFAARQYGCVATWQAKQVITKRQLSTLVSKGLLSEEWPGVYLMAGFPDTWHQRALGVALSIPGSALSHRSAARLLGLTFVVSERIHITAPGDTSPLRDRVKVHRSNQLSPYVTTKDGFPITNVARTIVDLSSCLSIGQLGAVFDQACNKKLVTIPEVHHCLDHMITKGRSRISNLREVLAVRNLTDENLDTFLERQTLKWLRDANFPEPESQQWITANGTSYRPDLLYRNHRIAIEPDGPHHLLPSVAAYDRMRDADMGIDGWLVFHVYPETQPEDFLERLHVALNRREPPAL